MLIKSQFSVWSLSSGLVLAGMEPGGRWWLSWLKKRGKKSKEIGQIMKENWRNHSNSNLVLFGFSNIHFLIIIWQKKKRWRYSANQLIVSMKQVAWICGAFMLYLCCMGEALKRIESKTGLTGTDSPQNPLDFPNLWNQTNCILERSETFLCLNCCLSFLLL